MESENNSNNNEELKTKYIEFIKLINENSAEEKIVILDEEKYKEKINLYFKNVSDNKKFKKYLLERRDKLFYSDNVKLFDNINIRKILEKVSDEIKTQIWTYLQLFYILSNPNNDNYTLKLITNIEENINGKPTGKKKCDDLVNDIMENIKIIMSDLDNSNDVNPLTKVIEISKQLSEKYRDDINEGNITLNDLMEYILNFFKENNLDEHLGDLNLSDENLGNIFGDLLNMEELQSFKNLSNLNLDSFGDVFNNILEKNFNSESENKKPLTDKNLEEMEKYFENLSTDNLSKENLTIDEKELDDKDNNLGNLADMLFSQINNINLKSNEEDNDNLSLNCLDELNKLKDNLMEELDDDQKNEIQNLTNSILKGFNIS